MAPGRRSAVAAAVAGLLLVPSAAAVRSSTFAPARTGDPAGIRLAQQVNRSYASVPAVRMEGTTEAGFLVRFTFVLRNGVVVAEQLVGRDTSAQQPPLVLVRRENEGSTFAHDVKHSCWLLVPTSDDLALTEVGKPILGPGRVSKPRVVGDTITMTLTKEGQTARVVVDRKTSQLRRFDAPGLKLRYTSLAKRPTLPVPKPRC